MTFTTLKRLLEYNHKGNLEKLQCPKVYEQATTLMDFKKEAKR